MSKNNAKSQKDPLSKDFVIIGPDTQQSSPKTLEVQLGEENIQLKVDGQSSVLESLIEDGHNPPYSCMEGNCMACLATVVKGAVYQEQPGILLDDNIENHEALTCQCRPLTSFVRIRYDNF